MAISGCARAPEQSNALDYALASTDSAITRVLAKPETYEVQILYTAVNRHGDSIELRDYEHRVNPKNYFYPASTVKFPIAVLALEYIDEKPDLTLKSVFYVEGDSVETTFEEEILKIFAISDNAANNRLVELLGQDRINSRLQQIGVGPVRISHRLSVPNADEITTTPIIVYLNDSTTTTLDEVVNTTATPLTIKKLKKGKAFYQGDSLVKKPMDFSLKNYYPISTQQEVLKRVIFPELFPPDKQFKISDEQREFLLGAMKVKPRELGYDPEEFYDSYGKFFIYGDSSDNIPDNVEIYNKVGYAYGTLTDCAYIRDVENDVEFMITATVLVNSDGIFNDDVYEYDEVGIPFLSALGRKVYEYERNLKH